MCIETIDSPNILNLLNSKYKMKNIRKHILRVSSPTNDVFYIFRFNRKHKIKQVNIYYLYNTFTELPFENFYVFSVVWQKALFQKKWEKWNDKEHFSHYNGISINTVASLELTITNVDMGD